MTPQRFASGRFGGVARLPGHQVGRMISNLFGGGSAQELLDSAPFCSELLYTAIPQRASSGVTATFTRATTSTWQNNDGYMVTGVAGEIGFVGARRVWNLLTYTEDFSNAAWTKENITVTADQAVAPDGTTTADKLTPSGTVAFSDILNSATVASGRTVALSIYAKKSTSNFIFLRLTMADFAPYTYFNLNTGAVGVTGAGITATITPVGDGWYRCCVIGIVSAAPPANRVDLGVSSVDGALNATAADSIYIWHPQLEDVTAQTTQTAGEYVSVGVTSAPYYHGSMVDGVKCFPTDLSGNPIPSTTLLGYQAQGARTNLCLQSNAFTTTWTQDGLTPVQDATGPDGGTTAWTLTDNSAVASERIYQSAPLLTAAAYTLSVFVKKTTGAQTGYPVIDFYPTVGAANFAGMTVDTTNGIATAWTARTGSTMASGISANCISYNDNFWRVSLTVTGTAANYYVVLYPAGTTNATQSTGALDATAQGSAVFYGAQVELGSFASPYIATTTVAVTRNADVLTYTGGDIPNLKTLAATFKRESGVESVGWAVALSDGTISNYESISAVSATQARFLGVTGGATQWDVIPSYTAGTTSKAAFSAATNDIKMAKDGVAQTQDTSATVPTVTQLNVGHVAGSFQFSGNVGGIYGWTRNLSQSELQAITS